MKVGDFRDQAGKRLAVVEPEWDVHRVAALLAKPGIDLVIVTGKDGEMLGVVTDSDIVSWVANSKPGGASAATAEALMSRSVFSCTVEQVFGTVVEEAVNRGRKHFPVLDKGRRPIGVVYVSDALMALHKESQLSPDTLVEYIHGRGYR
jgi:signal-transduction protein with cAMP-binding, CBS, and nucleotidyltransferase domain